MDKVKKQIMNQLYGQDVIVEFILGGMATFTVHNKIAKSQFTYRVKEASQDLFDDKPPDVVYVLDTENDTGNYYFLGWISPTSRRFVYGETSRIAQTAISVKTFRWLWAVLVEMAQSAGLDVAHEYLDQQAKIRTKTGQPSNALDGLPMFADKVEE